MSEHLCQKCHASQDHRVFETLPPFLPPEIAILKRKWQKLIQEQVRHIVKQVQAEGTAIRLKERLSEREVQDWLIADPQIVQMQKCLADLAIFETSHMLQTWSCQPKKED